MLQQLATCGIIWVRSLSWLQARCAGQSVVVNATATPERVGSSDPDLPAWAYQERWQSGYRNSLLNCALLRGRRFESYSLRSSPPTRGRSTGVVTVATPAISPQSFRWLGAEDGVIHLMLRVDPGATGPCRECHA